MTIIPIKKKSIGRIIAFYQLLCAAFKVLIFGETTLVFIDETDEK